MTELSDKACLFKNKKSPVREIMSYADPQYIKKIGLNPEDVVSFAGGWVNHASPPQLQEKYKEIVNDFTLFHSSGAYSPTLGFTDCRVAISNYEQHVYNIPKLSSKNIIIGASSTQLTLNLFRVLLNPGDKILLLDPSYCNYVMQIEMSQDNIHILRFPVINNDAWEYDAEKKIDAFSHYVLENRPKVILLVAPDNPTSQILSDNFVASAIDCAKKIGAYVVIDFAYKDLVFDDALPKYFSLDPTENFLSIHSNSKWGRNLGRRLGWIEAPEHIISAMESFQNSTILCPDTLHQMALTRYINEAIANNTLKQYLRETANKYKIAAEQTVNSIREHIKLPCFQPSGGIYTCIKLNSDSAQFTEDVLKNTGVLFVPGWGFGNTLRNSVRVSYGPLVDNINKINSGLERVGAYIHR